MPKRLLSVFSHDSTKFGLIRQLLTEGVVRLINLIIESMFLEIVSATGGSIAVCRLIRGMDFRNSIYLVFISRLQLKVRVTEARLDNLHVWVHVKARLNGANLSQVTAVGCNLTSAFMRETCLDDANFTHAKLSGAKLQRASKSLKKTVLVKLTYVAATWQGQICVLLEEFQDVENKIICQALGIVHQTLAL